MARVWKVWASASNARVFSFVFGKGVFLVSSLKSLLGTGREEIPHEEGSDRRQV